jgi:uncharacterized protein DUF4384
VDRRLRISVFIPRTIAAETIRSWKHTRGISAREEASMKALAIVLVAAAVLVGLSATGFSQEGAKAIFYSDGATVMAKPAPSSAPTRPPQKVAEAPPTRERYLGIKYWIELVKPDGSRVEVAPDRVFQSGDRIKVRVETNRNGYLYLLSVGSTGRYQLLFPHPKLADGSNLVKARTVYDVPHGALIRFDDNAGEELLLIVLSPNPMGEPLPSADPRTRALPAQEGQRLVKTAQLQGAKDLTLEVDTGSEPAGYAVAPLAALTDQIKIVVELKLRHR